jgi:putative transposase
MVNYRCIKVYDPALRACIKEIAGIRIRYGYQRITALLRREGWNVNRKRVRRIYREEHLAIRTKSPKRRRSAMVREERALPTAPNQTSAMDFMHDMLADGTKIRLLTIVDTFSRESVALEVGFGFKSTEVVDVLRRKVAERGTRSASRAITARNSYRYSSINGRIGTA